MSSGEGRGKTVFFRPKRKLFRTEEGRPDRGKKKENRLPWAAQGLGSSVVRRGRCTEIRGEFCFSEGVLTKKGRGDDKETAIYCWGKKKIFTQSCTEPLPGEPKAGSYL